MNQSIAVGEKRTVQELHIAKHPREYLGRFSSVQKLNMFFLITMCSIFRYPRFKKMEMTSQLFSLQNHIFMHNGGGIRLTFLKEKERMMTNSMAESVVSYEFQPGKRSIFAEIYFPKKVAYQGAIFEALEGGLNEEYVRAELVGLTQLLLETELSVYPHWFDPDRYTTAELRTEKPTLERARTRMAMYSSPFHGWSMYEVDGVFLSKRKRNGKRQIDEERTQVIRLIFVFDDKEEKSATKLGHLDVYRAILYWVMSIYGHTDYDAYWSDGEMKRFLSRHGEWDSEKRRYAERHYKRLAGAITKWIDDCGLFIFGFLVRELWKKVVDVAEIEKGRKLEDEIWVSSIFHFNINVMKPRKASRRRVIIAAAQAKEQE